jgi:hypothetical protein
MASTSEPASDGVDGSVDMSEASRQLEQAAHDARVAYDCLALGDVDRAHVHTITARAAADAAENVLRAALGEGSRLPGPIAG